jgi:hypothetical protein
MYHLPNFVDVLFIFIGIVAIVPLVLKGFDFAPDYRGFVNLVGDSVKYMNNFLLIFLAHF